MPNPYDPCDCGHTFSYHDQVNAPNICRFASEPRDAGNCGCQGFSVNGVLAGPGTVDAANDPGGGDVND